MISIEQSGSKKVLKNPRAVFGGCFLYIILAIHHEISFLPHGPGWFFLSRLHSILILIPSLDLLSFSDLTLLIFPWTCLSETQRQIKDLGITYHREFWLCGSRERVGREGRGVVFFYLWICFRRYWLKEADKKRVQWVFLSSILFQMKWTKNDSRNDLMCDSFLMDSRKLFAKIGVCLLLAELITSCRPSGQI